MKQKNGFCMTMLLLSLFIFVSCDKNNKSGSTYILPYGGHYSVI